MEHLLFLAHRIPYPPNKGDKLRSFHLLKYLTSRYRVHVGTFVDDEDDWNYVAEIRKYCGETYFANLNPLIARIRSIRALAFDEPLTIRYYRDDKLSRWVDSIVARYGIKRMIAFSSPMAQYITHFESVHRLADMVDVDSAKWVQYASQARWPMSWLYRREGRTLLEFERRTASILEATVFVSAAEAELFRSLSGLSAERISSAANGVDAEYFSPERTFENPYPDAAQVLAFTGAMDYWPNVDAVQWFAREVFPLIRSKWADARFAIVGTRPTPEVTRLAKLPGVIVTGTVPDVRPYLAHASAVVAPLRIARGVQNKVLEGMAMGRSVIASPEAAEGIEATSGREIVIATTPADYLAAASSVFEGVCDFGKEARARVQRSYSWESNLGRLVSLFDQQADRSDAVPHDARLATQM